MNEEVVVDCVCGCHLIRFTKFDDDDQIYMETYELSFYSKVSGKIRQYFQRMLSAICGKNYLLYDIVLSHEDAKKLARKLFRMTEIEQ